jgi:hypothetical protein
MLQQLSMSSLLSLFFACGVMRRYFKIKMKRERACGGYAVFTVAVPGEVNCALWERLKNRNCKDEIS